MLKNNTHKKSNSKKNNLKYSKKRGGSASAEKPNSENDRIKKILAIHDPSLKGLSSGDVDDWYSILYVCNYLYLKKMKLKTTIEDTTYQLHVIITEGQLRGGNPQYLIMVYILNKMYPNIVVFHLDNTDLIESLNLNNSALRPIFDVCFISAPLNQEILSFLLKYKEIDSENKTIFYLQGGMEGYNSKSSKPPGSMEILKTQLTIIPISSELTNQAFNKNLLIDDANSKTLYHTTPFFDFWDTYQLKKLFSIIKIPSILHLVYGFWFNKEDDAEWGNLGNSKNTLRIIQEAIGEAVKVSGVDYIAKNPELAKQFTALKDLYDIYCDSVCELKNTKTPTDEANLVKKKDELKAIYEQVIILALYLFKENTMVKLVGLDNTLNDLGQLDNFGIIKELKYTPKLYDFNMASLIITMADINTKDITNIEQITQWHKEFHNTGENITPNISTKSKSSANFNFFLQYFNENYNISIDGNEDDIINIATKFN